MQGFSKIEQIILQTSEYKCYRLDVDNLLFFLKENLNFP